MAVDSLDPKRTCLLFFDTSNLFVNGPTLDPANRTPQVVTAVANWRRLLAAGRELGMMVAYAHTAYRPDGANYYRRMTDKDLGGNPVPEVGARLPISRSIMGTREVQVVDEITPAAEDYMFWKPRWNPFHQTSFELSLRLRGIDTLVINGGSTEIGIAATAYAAHSLDFDCVFVADGCTSGHQDCHDLLMGSVFPRIGRVRTADQVLAMLRAGQS